MEKPKSYCEAVLYLDKTNVHRVYHDKEYGCPSGGKGVRRQATGGLQLNKMRRNLSYSATDSEGIINN